MLNINPVMFSLGNIEIRYYSFFILIGVVLAILLLMKEGKRFGYAKDDLFDLVFWTILFGIIGARIYYVIFNFSLYKDNLISIFKVWEGGLAIHGGLIFGIITAFIYCKKKHLDIIRIIDISVVPLLLAQAIGRWGNFFNGEAHGAVTTLENLQHLHLPNFIINGMNIDGLYYEPTFLYESIWCLIGFVLILIIRRLKYVKKGTMMSFYLMWYSVGRFYIESLRTDSLMLGGFKVAQIVSLIMFLIGFAYLIYTFKLQKYENLYNIDEQKSISI